MAVAGAEEERLDHTLKREYTGSDAWSSEPMGDVDGVWLEAAAEEGIEETNVDLPTIRSPLDVDSTSLSEAEMIRTRNKRTKHLLQSQEQNEQDMENDDRLSPLEKKFLLSVTRNLPREAEAFLLQGVDVHTRNSFGRDAMQICARNGYIRMAEVCLFTTSIPLVIFLTTLQNL